ncbi:MAG: hypothetical protein V1712_02995 [Patescibacteria group bacterium]
MKKTQKKPKKQRVYCQVSWKAARAAISLFDHFGRTGIESFIANNVKVWVRNVVPGLGLSNPATSGLDGEQSVEITWLYVRALLRLMISVVKKTYALGSLWKTKVDEAQYDIKAAYTTLSSALEKSDLRKGDHWKLIEEPLNLLTKILESNGRYHGSLPRYLIEVEAPIAEIKMLI